jgi:hypothetical protein
MAHEKDPFDLKLTPEQEESFTAFLVEHIRAAKRARGSVMDDGGLIDFGYALYEQQSQKPISRNSPRYGAADLTSPIITENVDALTARTVQTIFRQEPLWIAEGAGPAREKEPIVEEFMQWRQEQMRLQQTLKRGVTAAYVEFGSVLEVCEDAERVVRHEVVRTACKRHPEDGSILIDGKTGQPLPDFDASGEPVPAPDDSDECVEVKRATVDYKRRGAYVRRRSMKDFAFLPSHAEDPHEVWGHATRFWERMCDIASKAEDGEYRNIDALGGDTQERQQSTDMDRANVSVETVYGFDQSEKELWRVQCWYDADGDGKALITAVVSETHAKLLSARFDWIGRFRTVYLNPYPCPYSVYGYSLALTKLITTQEEHTSWRNMNADRSTLKSNAPLKKRSGSRWDPSLQPFGAGEVIELDDPARDVIPFEFEDVTQQAMAKEQQCVVDAQRIVGMSDIAAGQDTQRKETATTNQMVTRQSFVRTDDPIGNIQEALEEIGELIHAIEVESLREQEEVKAPAAVAQRIQLNSDPSFQGTFTPEMLEGSFRFKPRGSSENADPNRRQQVFVNGLGVLAQWAQQNPQIAMRMQSEEMANALMQMWVTEFKPRDPRAFLAPVQPPQQMALPPGMGPEGAGPAGPGGPPQFGGNEVIGQLLASMPTQGAPA